MSYRLIAIIVAALVASNIYSDCCTSDCKIAQKGNTCGTHPVTKKCPGIDLPTCQEIIDMNPGGICEDDYVACRNAINAAPCGVCPSQCASIEGACGWEMPGCTSTSAAGNLTSG